MSYTFPEAPYPPSAEKLCDHCGTPIPRSATVCKQCRNFQGARFWLRLAGINLPWLTAIFYIATFSYANIISFLTPLRAEVQFIASIVRGSLDITITNRHSRSLFVQGTYFVCNLQKNPDRMHYLSLNLETIIPRKIEADSVVNASLDISASGKLIDDPEYSCAISLMIDDLHGKDAILRGALINLDKLDVWKGAKFTSP